MTDLGKQIFDLGTGMNQVLVDSMNQSDQTEQTRKDRSLTSKQVESILTVFAECESSAREEKERYTEFGSTWSYFDGVAHAYHLAIAVVEHKIR